PGERTYLAIGRRLLAEVALAERRWGQARAELSRALAVLRVGDAPLAAWRVYATGARLHDRQGRRVAAARDRAKGLAVFRQLVEPLGDIADRLRLPGEARHRAPSRPPTRRPSDTRRPGS
ncbi:MAG: hypothetical protein ACRDY4_07085, partial [Acidimicrobiia bacterium]